MTAAAKKAAANKQENAEHVDLQSSDIDSNEEIVRQIRLVELETAQLTLARQRRLNEEETRDERTREQRAEDAQRNLEQLRAIDEATIRGCRHRQGGMGLEQTFRGKGDPSLVSHEGPIAGHGYIICTRCLGEWRTPNPSLKQTDPKEYAKQLAAYEEVKEMLLDSDSRAMGAPVFSFEKNGIPFIPDRV